MFREQLKQEQRDLKMEMDTLPKSQRKDYYRVRKEQLDSDQQKRVRISANYNMNTCYISYFVK